MSARSVLRLAALAASLGPSLAAASGSAATARCLRDPRCHDGFIVAHRANGFGAPENSREAVRRAVAAGIAVVEIDLHLSRDNRLMVIHDDDLSRTTTLKGSVKEFTERELERAFLANGETLPRFDEIYAIARGKAVLDLHFKEDAVEVAAEWLSRHGSFDDVVFFVMWDGMAATAARMRRKYPQMIVMAKAQDWAEVERVSGQFDRRPEIFHPDRVDPGLDLRLRAEGLKVFRNLMEPAKADPAGLAKAEDFFAGRLDFIQTDDPVYFLRKPK